MQNNTKTYLVHFGLVIATLLCTTLSGTEWMLGKYLFWVDDAALMSWADFLRGFEFSIPFLLILTVHEFGHYFTAKYHKIGVTLPYYIPMWLGFLLMPSFGTMGAFIKIKDKIYSTKHYFDIGVSGPLAGFVIAIGVIWYGFATLPEPEYIYQIHPEYEQYGLDYADYAYQDGNSTSFQFGDNLVFTFFEKYVADPDKMPNPNEIIHYPLILAGYLALFFTALNLLPIGQLDGGHIIFGLLGHKRHKVVSKTLYTIFLFYAGLGLVSVSDLQNEGLESLLEFALIMAGYLYFLYVCATSLFTRKQDRLFFATIIFGAQFLLNHLTQLEGYSGWLLFALVIGRFIGVEHPPVLIESKLGTWRTVLGWVALIVFVLCFSPEPFIVDIAQ